MARGFGLEFMKSTLSRMLSTCVKSGNYIESTCFKNCAVRTKSLLILTVIIGSRGPKISSFMISALRGGFNNIVGSIYL